MSKHLLEKFSESFPIEINAPHVQQFIMLMYAFETRQKHASALNSPYLGLEQMFFTTQDTNNLFDIFNVAIADVKKVIRQCPSVNTSFKVASDPYNLFTTYLLHKTFNSKELNEEARLAMLMALSKMLHYKFFTSFVNHEFKHGANKAIMEATINGLSEKFDIIKYGTWKCVIENRCEDLINKTSIHYNTISKYDDDKAIMYLVTDVQTRIRNKIKIIVTEYYNVRSKGNVMTNTKLGTEIDGEKLIMDQVSTYDTMITNISNQVLNINQWLDNNYISIVVGMYNNLNTGLVKQMLTSFSQKASLQSRKQLLDKTTKKDGQVVYEGSRVLIKYILQKTYRACIQSKVNMKNKLDILTKSKNLYASSRIADPDIVAIKQSVAYMLDDCITVTREATISSLRLSLITYIMLKSFEYL